MQQRGLLDMDTGRLGADNAWSKLPSQQHANLWNFTAASRGCARARICTSISDMPCCRLCGFGGMLTIRGIEGDDEIYRYNEDAVL